MANEGANAVITGVLGRLPAWPRKPLNNSVIAAEQAYRKRTGLPSLTEEEMAALRAGEQMPWERGEGSAAATPASTEAPKPLDGEQPPPAAPSAGLSPAGAELLKGGFKWSKSSIAAEQARRKRNNLPPLTDADVAALLGEQASPVEGDRAASSGAPAPAQTSKTGSSGAPVPVARPAAVAAPVAAPPVARQGAATRYVGTPAVGTSTAAAAGGIATAGPENTEVNRTRRRLVWTGVVAFLATWLLAFFRFFLPRTLFEPNTVFKIGYPTDFGLGVDTKFQQQYRIWVDRTPGRLFVIYAKCTHLGCTPDWKPSENKFKCPCHGSGYDSEGVNFEGPAPRPMDRAHVELAPDGQIIVDTSRLYSWPKGQPSHFDDPGSYVPV